MSKSSSEVRDEIEALAQHRGVFLSVCRTDYRLSPEDAEDAVQTTFCRAIEISSQYRGEGSVYSWMRVILHHIFLRRFRLQAWRMIQIDPELSFETYIGKESKEIRYLEQRHDLLIMFSGVTTKIQRDAVRKMTRDGMIRDHATSCAFTAAVRNMRKRGLKRAA